MIRDLDPDVFRKRIVDSDDERTSMIRHCTRLRGLIPNRWRMQCISGRLLFEINFRESVISIKWWRLSSYSECIRFVRWSSGITDSIFDRVVLWRDSDFMIDSFEISWPGRQETLEANEESYEDIRVLWKKLMSEIIFLYSLQWQ